MMASLGRREAWPALLILGVGLLTLATLLKAAQDNLPVHPPWILGVAAGVYAAMAVVAGARVLRSLALLVAALGAHALMALLMGWGYSAVEGAPRTPYAALQHGLWDYLPGSALQLAFAAFTLVVLQAWLSREAAPPALALEPELPADIPPSLADVATPQAAVAVAVAVEGVAAALLQASEVVTAGVWERDPQAALKRVQAVVSRTGQGLNSLTLEQVSLLVRAEQGRVAALLVTGDVDRRRAHDLLRELWGVGQRGAEGAEETGAA